MRYCTYPLSDNNGRSGFFEGYTDVDRQTELNDDDGSLTGLIDTISVNKDPFFAAPVEDIECASDVSTNMPPVCDKSSETCGTAKTSPYGYVTTVLYPDCGLNCPDLGDPKAPDYLHWWTRDCTNPKCFGVPLYREDINPDEQGKKPYIRMAGQAVAQRSTLTVNHGSYYMDTTVSAKTQQSWAFPDPNTLKNVFMGGHTYYLFLLFAKPKPADPMTEPPVTKQTYSVYVGPGLNADPSDPNSDVYAVQADVAASPFTFSKQGEVAWPWATPSYKDGILTVTMDMSFDDFKTKYDAVAENHCQPQTFCSWDKTQKTCGCALGMGDKQLYSQCQAVCSVWTQKDVDCPQGGCYGFAIKLSTDFVADDKPTPPHPACYPDDKDWNIPFRPADEDKAGACYYSPDKVPKGVFCTPLPGGSPAARK